MSIVRAVPTTRKLVLRGSPLAPVRSATIGGVLSAGLVVLGAVSAPLTALWLLQRRLIYFPDTAVPSPASVLSRAQEITLRTEDGLALGAWHVSPTRGD